MEQVDLDFSLNVALALAQAAYHPDDPTLLPTGWTKTGDINLTGTLTAPQFARWVAGDPLGTHFGIAATNGQLSAVCFRGTESIVEWAEDLNATASRDGVEEGFAAVFRALSFPSPVVNTIATGHSLGGALALQYAEQYLPSPAEVYTFGCPRVFTKERATRFDTAHGNCYRFANAWDVVPKAPPLGFRHVGTPIDVDGGISLNLCTNHKLVPTYRNGIQKLIDKLHSRAKRLSSKM